MKMKLYFRVTVLVLASNLHFLDSLKIQRTSSRITSSNDCHVKQELTSRFPYHASSSSSRYHTKSALSLNTLAALSRCDEYAAILSKPRWGGSILGPIVRYLNTVLIGGLFAFILRVLNKFTAIRRELLVDKIFKREAGRGMLTVSNHCSMADDPGLFSALIPWWRMNSSQMRWVLCTEDIFFFNPFLQKILAGGNVMPLDRSGSLEQPLFQAFQEKLAGGSWCHIFPEGKVRQEWRFEDDEPRLGEFKFGVGKLIAHCKDSPIIVPIYHRGMDQVIPEKVLKEKKTKKPSAPISGVPRVGKDIKLYVGESLDFSEMVNKFRVEHPGILESWRSTQETIDLYATITKDIKVAVLKLEAEAWNREAPKVEETPPSKLETGEISPQIA